MPKSLDKTKGARKRKKTPNTSNNNTESDGSDIRPGPKKKKLQKNHFLEGIEMSKQLASEVQNKRLTRVKRNGNKNCEPRLCGNGKPMPSLAELEAMYADSEDDENSPPKTTDPSSTERCNTPVDKPIPKEENLDSPTTLKQLASKVIDLISKTIVLDDDDGPPPPVIPQKRPKKSETPYIVGCKYRKQVPWAPKTKFCVGSEKYGIDSEASSDEDKDCPKKRRKRGEKVNISKSIFNAKSDEISEKLKEKERQETERHLQNGSPNSSDTVDYEFMNNSPGKSIPRSFSPLPSTSKDKKTILKNDRLFNESLQGESLSNDTQDDIELIEIPCETVVVDDSATYVKPKVKKSPYNFTDDCFIIVEPDNRKEKLKLDPPLVDDVYGSIDLTQGYENEVYEIGDDDIDDLLAQNEAILGKNAKKDSFDTVTAVDASVVIVEPEAQPVEQSSISNENNRNIPEVANNNSNVSNSVNTNQNAAITSEVIQENNRKNEVADVVTQFFRQPQNYDPTKSIDLTQKSTVDLTIMSRLSSWLSSSIESFLTGHQSSRRNVSVDDEVVIVNEDLPKRTVPSTITQNSAQVSGSSQDCVVTNVTNVPSQTNVNKDHNYSSCNITVASSNVDRSLLNIESHSPPNRSLGDCPICMDSLANNAVASTLCGHVFCMGCIRAAIQANGKKCPTCRKKLKGVGYHQLFL